jgi:cytidyltransferase-like protein
MIVSTADLGGLRGRVAMVDGGFDPLHDGHIAYFQAAKELGVPVLCNISGDHYVSGKHPPLLTEDQRAIVIDSIRFIDYTHVSQTTTEAILETARPAMYVKGTDWQGRLPAEQVELCERLGIEVVFVDTMRDSSSRILESYTAKVGYERD